MSNEEVEKMFDDLKYFEFEFDILEGNFSKIQDFWLTYSSKIDLACPPNPTLQWNKLHDYYILSAMASHGYDKFVDIIAQDPQYQILFIPFRMMNIKDDLRVRKEIRFRQNMLENALLLEAQLTKIGNAFDGYSTDMYSNVRLKHFHEMFMKQAVYENHIPPTFTNMKPKIRAIAQLELLVNDIDSRSDSYRPISIKSLEKNGDTN